jgi:hypothetical protein
MYDKECKNWRLRDGPSLLSQRYVATLELIFIVGYEQLILQIVNIIRLYNKCALLSCSFADVHIRICEDIHSITGFTYSV